MPNREDLRWLLEGKDAWNSRREENPHWWPDLSEAPISSLLEEAQRLTESGNPDLRSHDLKFANLSGSHLSGVDMTGADLGVTNFSQSLLNGAILIGVKCLSTDFRGALLRESDFTEADLWQARFQDAVLSKSNFDGASCTLADFSRADLSDSSFKDAKLFETYLVGADLTNCELWKAKVIRSGGPEWDYSKLDRAEDEGIESVLDLLKYAEEFERHYKLKEGSEPTLLYYRGESEKYAYRIPSVMRANSSCEYPLRSRESEMLVDLMTRRPDDFAGESTALSHLMTAQHFGLPTRLLDVTRNPLVALFHATATGNQEVGSPGQLHILTVRESMVKPYTSPSVSVVTNFSRLIRGDQNLLLTKTKEFTEGDSDSPPSRFLTPLRSSDYQSAMSRLVQFIRVEHPSFEDRIDPIDLFRVFVVEPRRSNERIIAQAAAFLLSAFHERFDECEVQRRTKQLPIYHQYTFEIPSARKSFIRRQLRSLNVSEETMYPGLQTAAEAVKLRYSGESESIDC